jgi:hypothetical protein
VITTGYPKAFLGLRLQNEARRKQANSQQSEATHGKTYKKRAFRCYPEIYSTADGKERSRKGTFRESNVRFYSIEVFF